jgi:hypothetical protein
MIVTINGKNVFSCSKEEIHEAWSIMQQANRMAEQRAAMDFYPGQRVSWESKRRYGNRVFAIIERINKTSITAREEGTSTKWKISPSLLRLEPEGHAKKVVLTRGQ